MRVGQGFDAHRFEKGRKLILGGEEIEHPVGLLGHSDADVLTHALIDALLGAAGLGDIGMHFPDTDPAYRDASSIRMLKTVADDIRALGFQVSNVDVTVFAQSPRISAVQGRHCREFGPSHEYRAGAHQRESHHHRRHGIYWAIRRHGRGRGSSFGEWMSREGRERGREAKNAGEPAFCKKVFAHG